MANTKDVELVFNGKSWNNKNPNITFEAGTVATIRVNSSLVIDKKLKRHEQKKTKKIKIFEDGDELLVALKQPKTKTLSNKLMGTLCDKSLLSFCNSSSLPARFKLSNYSFVKATLKQADSSTCPTKASRARIEEGWV